MQSQDIVPYPEGGSESESSDSDDDLESSAPKGPNVPFESGSSPQGLPVKQPPAAADNKMEVDPTDAWSLAFEPEETAVDEAVSMDASDVGWGDTPAATTDDTGWATFDSFTDIRMATSSEPTEEAADSPVAMETESPAPSQAGAAYIVKEDSISNKPDELRTYGLVSSAEALGVTTDGDCEESTRKTEPSPVQDRAARYRCEGQSLDNSAPLATNDSDDDISDEETAGVKCEEVFSRVEQDNQTEGIVHSNNEVMTVNNAHDDQMTSAKLDNGPVDCTKDTEHQGLTKKTKLDQDSRSPLKELVETQTNLVNGPG